MNIVLNKINQILMEKYLKLQDTCRTQVRREQSPRAPLLLPAWQRTSRGRWSWGGLGDKLLCSTSWKGNWGGGVCHRGTWGVVGGCRGRVWQYLCSPLPPIQLVWLLRELVKSGVLGADGVCMTFMKQIAGGFRAAGSRI